MSGFRALVLAGSRAGGHDAVAAYGGAPHKALIRLGGRTLLARVLAALAAAGADRVMVVTSHAEVAAEAGRCGAEVIPEAPGPSLSVLAGAERLGTPLLVTTADHALLEPEWIRRFLDDTPPDVDVTALAAARVVVEAAVPATQRTWLKLADGDWSGCNLFYLATPRALAAVELWRRLEAERKRPWRMAGMLGIGMLVSYALGRLTLSGAARRLGRAAGVTAVVVTTPYGLASVDVDKPADLDLVRELVGE